MFLKRYPVRVRILEPRGNGFQVFWDRGRRIVDRKNGEVYYQLKKRKRIHAPEFKDVQMGNFLDLWHPSTNEYHPIGIDISSNPHPKMIPLVSSSTATLVMNQLADNARRFMKPNWWLQYGPMMVLVTAILALGISVYFIYNQFGQISQSLGGVAQSMDHIAKALENSHVIASNSPAPP